MPMISIQSIGGNQYEKARRLMSPVAVTDACTFRIPSSSRDERDHKVQFDDPELPGACSCTCEAGERGRPCWAMARALNALAALRKQNVYIWRGAASSWEALMSVASAIEQQPVAAIVEGELALVWGKEPRSGVLYNVPN